MTLGKVYGWSEFTISLNILIFVKFGKSVNFFVIVLQCTNYKEKTHTEQQLKVELEKYLYTRHIMNFSFF